MKIFLIILVGMYAIFLIHAATQPRSLNYSEGKVVDLPEEITQSDSTDILRARVTKDTIFIYFDNPKNK